MLPAVLSNVQQVWSFSPPVDEELLSEDFRSSSPISMPDHAMVEYQHPSRLHEVGDDAPERPVSEDISMRDAFEGATEKMEAR